MSEADLRRLVETFIKEVDTMDLMKDPAIREPASKHQRIIKQLHDLVQGFKHNYIHLNEGTKDES